MEQRMKNIPKTPEALIRAVGKVVLVTTPGPTSVPATYTGAILDGFEIEPVKKPLAGDTYRDQVTLFLTSAGASYTRRIMHLSPEATVQQLITEED